MAKLLAIDKCRFQGESRSRLVAFVGEYQVILSHTLAIECLMSDDCSGRKPAKNPIKMLHRLETLVKAGAYFGRSFASIRREEKANRCAVTQFIDEEATRAIREGTLTLTTAFVCREAEECRKAFDPWVEYVSGLGRAFVAGIKEKAMSGGFQEEIRETSKVGRFQRWLQAADDNRNDILRKWIPSLASDATEQWYTWQAIRLWYGWALEWAGRRAGMHPDTLQRDVSNDFCDMEYVASLSRADGLLTGDKELVHPLARAAFPKKDVFSSLEEVPDSHRCDWGSA